VDIFDLKAHFGGIEWIPEYSGENRVMTRTDYGPPFQNGLGRFFSSNRLDQKSQKDHRNEKTSQFANAEEK
jgi:hypothetical protein